jgi:hypothetical protein
VSAIRSRNHCCTELQLFTGYVTHATDRVLWALRLSELDDSQAVVARAWLNTIDHEVQVLEEEGTAKHAVGTVLALKKDRSIGWQDDQYWDRYMRVCSILPGED